MRRRRIRAAGGRQRTRQAGNNLSQRTRAAEGSVLLDTPGATTHNRMTTAPSPAAPFRTVRDERHGTEGRPWHSVVGYQDGSQTISIPAGVPVTLVAKETVTLSARAIPRRGDVEVAGWNADHEQDLSIRGRIHQQRAVGRQEMCGSTTPRKDPHEHATGAAGRARVASEGGEPVRQPSSESPLLPQPPGPEHVTNDTRRLFKRNILDSLGCAVAALRGQPFHALREQFEEYRAPGRCNADWRRCDPGSGGTFNSNPCATWICSTSDMAPWRPLSSERQLRDCFRRS